MNLEIETQVGTISAGISRINGVYEKYAHKQGISYGIINIFYMLRFHDAVTQNQIAEICMIPKQTVHSFIKQLKTEGYIVLAANGNDKREKEILLTPRGEKYSQELLEPFFELHEKAAKRLGTDFLQQLSNILTSLGDIFELELELKQISEKWEEKTKQRMNNVQYSQII